jgi:V/A-type H+-transporting ATPase subunit A
MKTSAYLWRIAGPVAVAKNLDAKMYDVVLVGTEKLLGEVIQIVGEKTIIQVYEDTSGLKLTVELGPGILTSIYDGIQRPLQELIARMGDFINRGARLPGLDPKKKWDFVATCKASRVKEGQVLGYVEEVPGFKHYIMVPPGVSGEISSLKSGSYAVSDTIATVNAQKICMKQDWPVRVPRPVGKKLTPATPLITGQRIMDTLFPIAKGGTAIISGPFGAGKTVNQQQLAKWSDADIIVYVGCGERGNEMTEVLTDFPELKDPRNGAPLMNRTVLIANTSNMPVAAREASIYTGITIGEYFRDMGYDVAMMADSTSRWAEALREISSRLEEMPGEEGYPAYLASRLAEFYERACIAVPLGAPEKSSSLSIIGAVSPPGGDFFEPVTQSSLRVAKAFWALDAKIAQKRHFPSINWLEGYTLYKGILQPWYADNVAPDFVSHVERISSLLQEESQLLEIVQLVGSDALPESQQLTLQVSRLIREGLLQQSAYDSLESYCPLKKSYLLMKLMLLYHEQGTKVLASGVHFSQLEASKMVQKIFQFKFSKEFEKDAGEIEMQITALMNSLQVRQ